MSREVVNDRPAKICRGNGGIRPQPSEEAGPRPAVARLGLLGGNEVVCHGLHGPSALDRGHEAGIKAHHVKRHAARLYGVAELGKREGGGIGVVLVVAEAADGAAAVVPEDEEVAVRGVLFGSPRAEVRDLALVEHRALSGVLDEACLAILEDPPLARGGVGLRREGPLGRTARLQDHVHVVAEVRLEHLLDVGGCRAVAGLEVRPTHVDHHRGALCRGDVHIVIA